MRSSRRNASTSASNTPPPPPSVVWEQNLILSTVLRPPKYDISFVFLLCLFQFIYEWNQGGLYLLQRDLFRRDRRRDRRSGSSWWLTLLRGRWSLFFLTEELFHSFSDQRLLLSRQSFDDPHTFVGGNLIIVRFHDEDGCVGNFGWRRWQAKVCWRIYEYYDCRWEIAQGIYWCALRRDHPKKEWGYPELILQWRRYRRDGSDRHGWDQFACKITWWWSLAISGVGVSNTWKYIECLSKIYFYL